MGDLLKKWCSSSIDQSTHFRLPRSLVHFRLSTRFISASPPTLAMHFESTPSPADDNHQDLELSDGSAVDIAGSESRLQDNAAQKDDQRTGVPTASNKKPLTAKQAAKVDPSTSTKICDQCGKPSDVLIRCQKDDTQKWFLLCPGKCWKEASGGKVDGTKDTPWYRYGGVWKNKKAAASGKKPKHVAS